MEPYIRIIKTMIVFALFLFGAPAVAGAAETGARSPDSSAVTSNRSHGDGSNLSASTLAALCAAGFLPALFMILRERQPRGCSDRQER